MAEKLLVSKQTSNDLCHSHVDLFHSNVEDDNKNEQKFCTFSKKTIFIRLVDCTLVSTAITCAETTIKDVRCAALAMAELRLAEAEE